MSIDKFVDPTFQEAKRQVQKISDILGDLEDGGLSTVQGAVIIYGRLEDRIVRTIYNGSPVVEVHVIRPGQPLEVNFISANESLFMAEQVVEEFGE